MLTIEGRKSFIDTERIRLGKEREDILKRYEENYIYDGKGQYRKNVKEKSYVDGSLYIGEINNEHRHGKGIYNYGNGDKYAGEWRDDKFHGRGMYIFSNGERFDGELKEGA